ncbi:MAG: M48 family metallopeptidase [Nocardioidaceae bacterium]|nr:M48 family metallopeptidase [Nocardioidaceae bacterium]
MGTVVVSFAVVAVLAALLVPWAWVPGGHLVPAKVGSLFTPEQVARMERYSWWQRGLGWASYAVSLLVLAWFAFSAAGARWLHRLVERRRWWLGVPLAAVAVLLVQRLATLPFAAAAHEVDRRYGISTQGYPAWAVDQVKSFGVSWVTTTLALLVVVGFARRSPRWWFAWAGATALVLTLAGSFLYPVLVEPVFNTFTPMQAGPFKQSILRLAEQEGVHVDDVLVADASRRTTTLNAYVSGIGSTRRVVVYDTLLDGLSPAEARVVIAHELGHAKNNDVLLGTTLGAIGSVGAVALLALVVDSEGVRRRARVTGAADPASIGLLLALAAAGTLLASPLQNTVSRAIEARADRESLAATHADRTFVQMQRQLSLRSLQDPTPPALSQFWFGTHPTVLQRAGLPSSLRRAGE